MTLYVDGVSAATATNNGNLGTSQTINIGAFDYESTGNDAWGTGYLRDVRVSSNVRYSANFSVPTEALTADSDTTLLTCHLPYIADGSTNAHAITVNGNTKTEPFAPYDYRTYTSGTHGGSNFFTTSNDYLTIPYSSTLDFGSNDFTIEWWMNPTTTAGDQVIFVQSNNLGIYGPLWIRYNGGVLKAWATTAGGTFNVFNSTTISGSIPANLWTHVAITRNSSGVWKTYLNGVQSYTSTAAGSLYVNSNDTVIGGSSTANFDFEGSLADFRIVNGTVVYTSDFIPPTAPLTAITNTSLLLNGTNAGIIDKSQTSSVLVLNADTKCSSTQTKYRSTAIYTDGTGDTLQFGEQNPQTVLDWGIGGQPFTVEWWQYDTMPTSTNHTVGPCIGGASATWSGSNGHQWLNIFDSNNFYFQWWGTNNAVNSVNVAASTMNFIQNQWQHIAAVYNGSTYKIYIDGTEQFSTTITNTFKANTGQRFGILGSINGGAYITAAYYDDLRVTKGLARYTANFTPPTAALKG